MKFVKIFIMLYLILIAWQGNLSAQDIVATGDVIKSSESSQGVVKGFDYKEFESKQMWHNKSNEGKKGVRQINKPKSPWHAVLQLLGGLVVMIILGGGVFLLVKKFLSGSGSFFSNSCTEVLGRTYLDSKRYLVLIRLGKKVLLLGVTPEEINCLSEITDSNDIADIMRDAKPKTESGKGIFKSLLESRVEIDGKVEKNEISAAENEEIYTSEMAEIKNKLKDLKIS